MKESLKLTAFERLPELPISGRHVVASEGSTVTGGDSKGEALAVEIGIALPILAPISWHGYPPGFGPFDRECMDIPCTRDVGDQNQVEVCVTIDREPNPPFLDTWHPVVIWKILKAL